MSKGANPWRFATSPGGALFLVFLVLKLTGHITWSWWWVTAPLWGVVAFMAAVLLVVGLILLSSGAYGKMRAALRSMRGK